MRNAVDEPAGPFFEHEGVRLHYRSEGDAAKPALFFLHGWALDLRMWEPQAAALQDQYRVIRLDRRGFGESSGVTDPLTDARDAHALLEELNIPRAFVVGMSQGARAALALASIAPGCVSGLVLDGAPPIEGLMAADALDEVPVERLVRLLRGEGVHALRNDVAGHPFMQLRTSDAAMHALLARMLCGYRGDDLTARARSSTQPTLRLHALNLPVLALNGAHDTSQRRACGDAYCTRLPRCERALIPDSGHLPNLDNPSAYNAVLTGFFRRHAP
jgi:pimeloyl-ACP methyl ester carboxylesterase